MFFNFFLSFFLTVNSISLASELPSVPSYEYNRYPSFGTPQGYVEVITQPTEIETPPEFKEEIAPVREIKPLPPEISVINKAPQTEALSENVVPVLLSNEEREMLDGILKTIITEFDQKGAKIIPEGKSGEDIKGDISVYYKNLVSGDVYTYNENTEYGIASLIKAPFCYHLLTRAQTGEIDLNYEFEFLENDLREGTGVLKNAEFNTIYSAKRLIELSLRYSDNVAYRILRMNYSYAKFSEYLNSRGAVRAASNKVTATDCVSYMTDIYNFIAEENEYSDLLYTYMTNTTYPMIISSYPVVRKHGWAGMNYHDMAVVYAPMPYILVICTSFNGNSWSRDVFSWLSGIFEELSQRTEVIIPAENEMAQPL